MSMKKLTHRDMKDRVNNLKTQLLHTHPFFGVFLINTPIIEETTFPTAATNGSDIFYNPSFFEQLTDPEVKAVLLHEIFHMVYSHCRRKRRGMRDTTKWNVASDYSINWEIDDMPKEQIKLPNGITINGKPFNTYLDRKYRNMYVEQIYDLLPEDLGDGFDIHIDMSDDEDKQQDIEDRIITSYEITKKNDNGTTPNGIKRAVDDIRKSRVPWQRIFHRYLGTALAKEDYSYLQPNRRFIGQEMYLPSLMNHKIGTIAIAVDTSGSIGNKELEAFTAELRKVSALVSEVIVMSCDSDVHTFEVIRDMTNFQKAVQFKGGGGTSFIPPFEMLAKKRINPELFIYLTDLEGNFPEKRTIKYPVIWLSTTNHIAPFGKTIQMKI